MGKISDKLRKLKREQPEKFSHCKIQENEFEFNEEIFLKTYDNMFNKYKDSKSIKEIMSLTFDVLGISKNIDYTKEIILNETDHNTQRI